MSKLHMPLSIVVRETQNDGMVFTLAYAGELFDDSVIDELLNGLLEILKQIAHDIDQPVASLTLIASKRTS